MAHVKYSGEDLMRENQNYTPKREKDNHSFRK
jgi:hypothetical protein